jgi:hypothetical protein
MTKVPLSFVALDSRLREIPDGPAAVLNTPRWIIPLNVIGWLGILLGLTPSLLIHFMAPAMWMVWMGRAGIWIAILAFAPGFLRSVVVMVLSLYRWRTDQVQQMDHDLAEFCGLRDWLSQFSVQACTEALQFARRNRVRLASKIGLIAGSVEKLGLLPIAVVLAVQLKASHVELGATPLWQIEIAIFLAVTYAVGIMASLMRLRLELYEMVLVDSLESRGVEDR